MRIKEGRKQLTDAERQLAINEDKKDFQNKLDILKFVSEIKLRIKDDITSDFVLARLNEKDKEMIVEMTSNAYYAKKVCLMLLKERRHEWIEGEWKKKELTGDEEEFIRKTADSIFDAYMTKIYVLVALNRNVDRNYLINVLSGRDEEEKEGIDKTDEKINALKEVLKNEETSK